MTPQQQDILCDAQTSGGLLCVIRKESVEAFLALTKAEGLELKSIGETLERGEFLVEVI
jgi:selenide,water dikinase